jgi:hypothetical protein
VLGEPITVGQMWLPGLWDDEEDPDWIKLSGVEVRADKHRTASL